MLEIQVKKQTVADKSPENLDKSRLKASHIMKNSLSKAWEKVCSMEAIQVWLGYKVLGEKKRFFEDLVLLSKL